MDEARRRGRDVEGARPADEGEERQRGGGEPPRGARDPAQNCTLGAWSAPAWAWKYGRAEKPVMPATRLAGKRRIFVL